MSLTNSRSAIINRKDIDVSNRIDAEFFNETFTSLEEKLTSIPHDSLGYFAQVKSSIDCENRRDPSKTPDLYFYYIDISNTSKKDGTIYPQYIKGEDAPSRARNVVKTGDIIVSTVRPNKNAVALIYPEYNDYICSTGFAVLEPKQIDARILFVYLKTSFAIIQLIRRTRATMYPAVNADLDIPDIIVPKCILELQDEIIPLIDESISHFQNWSSIVDRIDEKMEEKFNIDLLGDISKYQHPTIINRKTLMTDANRCDAEFFEGYYTDLYNILKGYEQLAKLSDIVPEEEIFTGKTPARSEYVEDENCPCIVKVGTLSNKGINWDDVEFIPASFFNANRSKILEEGDILLTSSAHSRDHIAKKIDVVNDIPPTYENNCIFTGELMLIRLNNDSIDPYYVASFLRTSLGRIQIQRCIRGITSHIYPDDIRNFVYIPLTDCDFMDEISSLVKESENERKMGRTYLDRAKSLMINEITKAIT